MRKLTTLSILYIFALCSLLASTASAENWNISVIEQGSGSTVHNEFEYQDISIALDSQNLPGVSFKRKTSYTSPLDTDIKYAHFDGTNWTIQKITTETKHCCGTGLDFDSNDRPRVVYDNYPSPYSHSYAEWNGTTWNIQRFSALATTAAIAVDNNDLSHIAWYTNSNLEYRIWNGINWQIETVDYAGDVGYQASLVLDNMGRRYVAYAQWGHKLKYAHYNGTTWSVEFVDTAIKNANGGNPIVLDSQNNPHILYADADNTLTVASKKNGTWQFQKTPLVYSVVEFDIAIDAKDQLHIIGGEYNSANNSYTLKYFLYDGTIWKNETIEKFDNPIGPNSSARIVLSNEGAIHVAYTNPVNFDLKYATKDLAINVIIDIKPGSFPNTINLGSHGTVPVTIFSTTSFDATTIDPATITLASAPVKLKGKGTPMASFDDINQDGILDLVVHVSTEALQLNNSDTQAIVEGQTFSGDTIRGTDSVRIVN